MMIRPFCHSVTPAYSCSHSHPAGQLMLVSEGTCRLRLPGQEVLLTDGAASWIPSGLPHSIVTCGAVAGITVLVEEEDTDLWPASARHLHASPFLSDLLERAVAVRSDTRRVANLCAVIADEVTAPRQSRIVVPMPHSETLRAICEELLEQPDEPRSVQEICADIGWSQRTFERRFTRETGLSYGRWKTQARLSRAALYLASGRSVTEVAFDVGYSSMSAFSSAFRTLTGKRPSEFRRTFLAARTPGTQVCFAAPIRTP